MQELSPTRSVKFSAPENANGEQIVRPNRLWRWTAGAIGLMVCVLTVRYVAQHPQLLAIVFGLPVLGLGALVVSRAPRVRVSFSATELRVVGLFRSRRIARDRVVSVGDVGGKPAIRWTSRRGRERATKLPGVRGRSARGTQFLQALADWVARPGMRR